MILVKTKKRLISFLMVLMMAISIIPISSISTMAYYPGYGKDGIGFVYQSTRGPGHWNLIGADLVDVSFTWDMCYYVTSFTDLPGNPSCLYNYASYGGGNDGFATAYAEKGFVTDVFSEGAGTDVHYIYRFATPRFGSGDHRNWSHWGNGWPDYDPYLEESMYGSYNFNMNTTQEEKDKYLAMAMTIVAGPDSTHQASNVFCSDDSARRAVSAVLSAIFYDLIKYDPNTHCLVRSGNDPYVKCIIEDGGTEERRRLYEHNVNQDMITIMSLVDSYMTFEKTGEIKTNLKTGNSAKELLASEHPEDNLVCPNAPPEIPSGIWQGKISSVGAVNYLDGSGINPYAWSDGNYTWTTSRGYIEIQKSAEDQSANSNNKTVRGITFIATNTVTGEEYSGVTNDNGYLKLEVKPGTYTVTEIKPPKYNR